MTSAEGSTALPQDNVEHPEDPVAEELDRQIGDLIPDEGSRHAIVARVTRFYAESFSGPIAHPRHLAEYERICPGAADRIITMAEQSAAHHASMDREGQRAEIADRKLGMFLGAGLFFSLIMSALAVALWTENMGLAAFFLGAGVLSSGVGLFIKGRSGSQ